MDAGEDQNAGSGSTNGNAQTGGNAHPPQIAHMSLYERQAVQALQALQRQPNAAQYIHQLMLQQQINSAQLHNLAAVQQATLAASRQSSSPSNSGSQTTTTVNLSTSSAGGMTNPRPLGPATSATSSALSQSVLLGGNSAGQGQMYLRVNRSLRAPIASQLIFMPGGTTTAAVATVAQQQVSQQQQQSEVPPTSSSALSDNDQVQNLALHCVSTPRLAAVKSEFPDRKDAINYSKQQQQQQPQIQHQFTTPTTVPSHQFSQGSVQQQMANKMTGYTHPTAASLPSMNVKGGNQPNTTPAAAASIPTSSSSASPTLPLSQLLLSPSGLCQARAVTTVSPSATVTHILVPTSNVATSTQGYPIGSVATKTGNTQTLVVQPLQQANTDKGPVPIQPKTTQNHRLPVQLPPRHPPPILPAPPNNSQASTGGHHPPHIPVQFVGARQGLAGNSQVVALTQARSACAQDSTGTVKATNAITMSKPAMGSLKRKSETDANNDMAVEPSLQDCPPVRESAPPLSPAPTPENSAAEAVAAFSSPPTLSMSLPSSRGLGSQGERAPLPQAVVKPQVLTHLIEGFVIQEGAEPFPVAGLVKERPDGPFTLAGQPMGENGGLAVLKCEYCKSFAPASQFRGSKRFCSKSCAKRYNVSCSHHFRSSRERASGGPPGSPAPSEPIIRRRGPRRSSSEIACAKIAGRHLPVKFRSDSSRSEEASSCDGEEDEEEDSPSLSPSSSLSCPRPSNCGAQSENSAPGGLSSNRANFLAGSPAHWNVEEVCRFISSLQGCEELAAQFLSQEIDGQALLLLREEHLISTMNIKLGPALKICASINNLRD